METDAPSAFAAKVRGSGDDLRRELRRIDGAGYKAYNDVLGGWSFGNDFTLYVDKIQSDPFAPPSRCHLRVPMSTARFPPDTFSNYARKIALCDLLTRAFCRVAKRGGLDQAAQGQGWSGPKGGDLQMDAPGQQVIERTSVLVTAEYVEARFTVALPAAGRNILGHKATEILVDALPSVVQKSLLYAAHKSADVAAWCDTVEDTRALRASFYSRSHGAIGRAARSLACGARRRLPRAHTEDTACDEGRSNGRPRFGGTLFAVMRPSDGCAPRTSASPRRLRRPSARLQTRVPKPTNAWTCSSK